MYFKYVESLLKRMDAVQVDVLQQYLVQLLGISETVALQTIHSSARNRTGYFSEDEKFILRDKTVEVNGVTVNRNIALRFIINYLPDSDNFAISAYPWTALFTTKGRMVQIAVFDVEQETVQSMYISSFPVPEEDRETIRRIAIVKRASVIPMLKFAGFTHIYSCNITGDIELIGKRPFERAWEDVICP